MVDRRITRTALNASKQLQLSEIRLANLSSGRLVRWPTHHKNFGLLPLSLAEESRKELGAAGERNVLRVENETLIPPIH